MCIDESMSEIWGRVTMKVGYLYHNHKMSVHSFSHKGNKLLIIVNNTKHQRLKAQQRETN